jgi:SAM-dependent methyltransferase
MDVDEALAEREKSGPQRALRKIFGPATDPAIRWYRHWWVDLEDFGRTLSRFGPVDRALEIGCGDGHLTECIVNEMPATHVTGIDIAAGPGNLFRGDRARVTFESMTAGDLARRQPASFGLVVLCDVLHHIPLDLQNTVLADARALVATGGHLVIKDWVVGKNPASVSAWLSDRYITGDRIKYFDDRAALVDLVTRACAPATVVAEGRVPPRWNNLYVALRPG